MTDWNSPDELLRDAGIFLKMIHVLSGVYFWEFITSLDFEWKFITRQKKFHWPMIFYFLGRYSMLFCLVGLLIAVNVTHEVNCQALYGFIGLAGQSSAGFPSLILAVRTMVIWSLDKRVVALLVVLILGHWSMILQGSIIKGEWVPGQGCAFSPVHHSAILVTFIYSVCFDFIVLNLTAFKLLKRKERRSQLVKLMFSDGLIYFLIAFIANIPAMVMMALDLNPVISVMFNIPAAIIATTVACRAVRRLSNFSTSGPELFSSKTNNSHSAPNLRSHPPAIHVSQHGKTGDGVHVQMDTFTVADTDSDSKTHGKYGTLADAENGFKTQAI